MFCTGYIHFFTGQIFNTAQNQFWNCRKKSLSTGHYNTPEVADLQVEHTGAAATAANWQISVAWKNSTGAVLLTRAGLVYTCQVLRVNTLRCPIYENGMKDKASPGNLFSYWTRLEILLSIAREDSCILNGVLLLHFLLSPDINTR